MLTAIGAAAVVSALASPVFAAGEDVRVFVDGNLVKYTEPGVTPQIVNGYAMVPLRQTAEVLGINVNWDERTRLITLTKDGRSVTHVFGTKTVSTGYESPIASMVVKDRTLMPVRMISEALNADTTWNDEKANPPRSVIIKSRPAGSDSSGGAYQQPSSGRARVESASVAKDEYAVGEEVTVSVAASGNAVKARLVTAGDRILADSSYYDDRGGSRSFTLRYTPTMPTLSANKYRVQVSDDIGFNTNGEKSVSFSVKQPMKLVSAWVDSSNPYLYDTVNISVTTSPEVKFVRLKDGNTGETYKEGTFVDLGDTRKFNFDIQQKAKGRVVYSVELSSDGSVWLPDSSQEISLNVGEQKPTDKLEVKEINVPSKNYTRGEEVIVDVKTSLSTDYIIAYDARNYPITQVDDEEGTYGDYKLWKLRVTLDSSSNTTFSVTAFTKPESGGTEPAKSVNKSFTVYVSGNNDNLLYGAELRNKDTSYYYITVYTSMDVRYVGIRDNSGIVNEQTSQNGQVDSANNRMRFEVSVPRWAYGTGSGTGYYMNEEYLQVTAYSYINNVTDYGTVYVGPKDAT
ncbi:MAG: copper amine oxidase N-terminal domain-containing protein [Clostridiales bacterium]|jgi:hypothetical protein|nr:copper amine oxidase N-terminal domain-containing protein [Clostridiales bacterium]